MRYLDRHIIFQILYTNKDKLLALGVKRIGLFGSFIRNEQNQKSDVDFLVDFNKSQKKLHNLTLLGELLEFLLERKVDIITTDSLSPFIGPHIIKEVEYAPFFN
jgi:predicted nucleotidyltransferase